jgi:flagellar hook-length control protein FliK
MNAAPIPPRDVKPIDRPPPRDPQAAGASNGTPASEEARFPDLVKDVASDGERIAKRQDRAAAASEAEKNKDVLKRDALEKNALEKERADTAAADAGTLFAEKSSVEASLEETLFAEATLDETTLAETTLAETISDKASSANTMLEATAASIALARPQQPMPSALGSGPQEASAAADEDAGHHGIGRTGSLNALASSSQTELSATMKAGEPQGALERFDALLTSSQTQTELTPPPPAPATATTAAGRLAEPAAAMAGAPTPQPPLPVAALPASIAIKALSGSNHFDIRLNPEELGRINVSLEIDQDGTIRASIAAERPEALQLIVREARALEQAFDQAGFRRDEGALNFSLSDRQSSPQDQENSQNKPQVTRFFVEGESELPPSLAALVNANTIRADGRLDVRI